MQLDLKPEEVSLMQMLLEGAYEDVRTEIHHCQNHDYKLMLKEREKLLAELLERIKKLPS